MKIKYKINYIIVALFIYSHNVSSQIITTFAGIGSSGSSYSGDGGPATNAGIGYIGGGNFDNLGNFYFCTRLVNRVRMVSTSDTITTLAGTGVAGYFGDGGQATNAQLNNPMEVAIDTSGNIYISDFNNNRIRKINANTGIITTIAGNGTPGFSGDGGSAIVASLNMPVGLCVDKFNNIYILDLNNHRVRKINSLGIISTVAGNGIAGYSSDGGLADTTRINPAFGITTDYNGNLYIADNNNYRIRKVDIITGRISTVVGNGNYIYNGEGLSATATNIVPWDIKFDRSGNLYISELSQRIRKVNTLGNVYTIAGTGVSGYSGDGGNATSAEIYNPEGVAIDACDNLFIADEANNRIRKVTFNKPPCTYLEIMNISENKLLYIYPNPTYDQININNLIAPLTYYLFNLFGGVLQYGILKEANNILSMQLLPAGMYFLEIIDEQKNRSTYKIVKK